MSGEPGRNVLVVPAINRVMEPELNVLCPTAGPFAVARVPLPSGHLTREQLPAYAASTLQAVAPFVATAPHLVVHGCTAAGFLGGRDSNARVVEALRDATGAVVVSTAEAMIEALRSEAIDEVAVVTPYLPAVNEALAVFLTAAGIGVETLASLCCETLDALCAVTEDEVEALVLRTVTPRSKAVFIGCVALPTLGITGSLRERLGIPVWSAVGATGWAVTRAAPSWRNRSER